MACSFSITIYVKLVFYFIDKNNLCTQSTLQPVCYRYRAILHGHALDIAHALYISKYMIQLSFTVATVITCVSHFVRIFVYLFTFFEYKR